MTAAITTLTELADRVSRLTGPCRETDCLIFEAGHRLLTPERRGMIDGEPTGEYFDLNGDQLPERSPFYTASLDAAMTLVPEGMVWRVGTMTGLPGAIVCAPNAMLSAKTAPRQINAATPALALTAASLRARASMASSVAAGERE